LLCLGIFLHLLPFYFMITTSFKGGTETMAQPPTIWPTQPTWAAWKLVFQLAVNPLNPTGQDPTSALLDDPFYVYLMNSLFQVLMTLLLSLPITALAAYSTSKLLRGPVARWSFLFFIGTLMIPAAVTLLPTLLLTLNFPFALPGGSIPVQPDGMTPFPTVSIWDTPWAIIIPSVFNAFNYLLFKGFFDTIPNSILQAARVDGGSEFNIFRRIVFPMSIPVFAVAAWTQFSALWDNYLWPSLAFRTTSKEPTSVAIYNLMFRMTSLGITDANQAFGQSQAMRQIMASGLTWNGLIVLGILQELPIFLMFLICREYLLRGIRLRGLK
jgi:ABC-type glycerol-3-phosphate transport system permease component